MTDLNKLDTKTAHTKVESRTEPPIDPQQVSIKAWSQNCWSFYYVWQVLWRLEVT